MVWCLCSVWWEFKTNIMALPAPSSLIKQQQTNKQEKKTSCASGSLCYVKFSSLSNPPCCLFPRKTLFQETPCFSGTTVFKRNGCTWHSLFQDRHSFWKLSVSWVSDFQDQLLDPHALRLPTAVFYGGNSCWIWICRLSSTDSHGGPVWAAAALGWGQMLYLYCCSFLPSRVWSGSQAVFPGHYHGSWRQILPGAHQPSCGNVSGRPVVPAFNPQDAGIKAGPRERTAFNFEWLL